MSTENPHGEGQTSETTESVLPTAQQEDLMLARTDLESHHYLALMQEFTQYMLSWKAVLFSPEYQSVFAHIK